VNLAKPKRNVIFNAVKQGGLDPGECTFVYDDIGARITHGPSYFLLTEDDVAPNRFAAEIIVGDNPVWPAIGLDWSDFATRVRMWSQEVKSDDETPDLWAELQSQTQLLEDAAGPALENTPFTRDERDEVVRQINELRACEEHIFSFGTTVLRRGLKAGLSR